MGQLFSYNLEGGKYSSYSSFDEKLDDEREIYYSVHLSIKDQAKVPEYLVFTDKTEALRVLKEKKEARLKAFSCQEEAIQFSLHGDITDIIEGKNFDEKILFRSPKSQELVTFRKLIERDDIDNVMKLVHQNPRYLIGSGDTPAILQEGSRYNALHVAAKAHSSRITSYILSVISSSEFIQCLYGSFHSNEEIINVLLDLYLNTPDKGCNETPLHFASKLGAVDVVKVLVSYQQCDRTCRNKEGLTAMDIACTRAPEHLVCNKNEIVRILKSLFYVPILRSSDDSLNPTVGRPFTTSSPPKITSPTAVSYLEVKALAGPMIEEEAEEFRKMLKTPPRSTKERNSPKCCPELYDPFKGLEKAGRKLARKFSVDWKEYWGFLDCFINLSTPEGLTKLDAYIEQKLKEICAAKDANEYSFIVDDSPYNNTFDQTLQMQSPISRSFQLEQSGNMGKEELNSKLLSRDSGAKNTNELKLFRLDDSICNSYGNNMNYSGFSSELFSLDSAAENINDSKDDICSSYGNDTNCSGFSFELFSYDSAAKNINESKDDNICCSYGNDYLSDIFSELTIDSAAKNVNEPTGAFITAPPSPVIEDVGECDNFFITEQIPDIFLSGEGPSKLDKAAFEAIGNVEVCPLKYPYVHLWKTSYIQRSLSCPMEKWPSPKPARTPQKDS